ncbi:MAG: hypothetical protein PSV36_15120 [Algoriphagus sp.]|nr:hypothetical protein [Algoriphagus sp.]
MESIFRYVIAIGGVVVLMLAWVWVQSLWRKMFSENISDEDVLAERRSCGNCGCTKVCKKEKVI